MSKKYILSEWPESQEFMGHPDCYLVQAMDNQKQLDSAYFVPEEIFLELKTSNKSVLDIQQLQAQYNFIEKMLRESMRKYLSRLLMNTSEDNPLKCKICLVNAEGFGLSTLNFPWVYEMWQHPTEGVIYFNYDPDGEELVEFDYMLLEDLVTICKELGEM